jgi:hypothetical protein
MIRVAVHRWHIHAGLFPDRMDGDIFQGLALLVEDCSCDSGFCQRILMALRMDGGSRKKQEGSEPAHTPSSIHP